MSDLLSWPLTALGGALVLLTLWDIFRTIWHPSDRGGLTRRVMAWTWRAGRAGRRRRGRSRLGGPVAMGAVVVAWVLLILYGWALVYWPHLPSGFSYGSSLDPASRAGPADALYLSAVTLTTLGFGDIVPSDNWLRVVVPVEALIGFGLLTAAVSWVLQVYPALMRRRALAVHLSHLRRVPTRRLVESPESSLAPSLLIGLAGALAQVRVDLTQYAETYYFQEHDAEASLPAMLGVARDLADRARSAADADVRYAGELLTVAVADFLQVVEDVFLRTGGSVDEIADAYADDHLRRVVDAG